MAAPKRFAKIRPRQVATCLFASHGALRQQETRVPPADPVFENLALVFLIPVPCVALVNLEPSR